MSIVLLLLGSNEGNRTKMLEVAREMIKDNIGDIIESSSIYQTEPWGFSSMDFFLNQAIMVNTYLSPKLVLEELLKIEETLGRKRISISYESRTIDIDILFYDDLQISTNELQIPHQHLHKRKFALVPLVEIAGNKVHPVFGKKVDELARECEDKLKVELYQNAESPK